MTLCLTAKNNGKENSVLSKKVTIKQQNVSLEKVLKVLSEKCRVRFSYSKNLVAVGKKVDVNYKKKSLKKILEDLLPPIGASYKVLRNRIILRRAPKKKIEEQAADIPTPKAILKQVIRGRVVNQDTQLPIIGANIVVKNSQPFMGASTDLDGNFKLPDVAVGRHTLLVSYLGYESKVLSNILIGAGKELVLEIGLEESFIEMEAVEVTANKQKAKPINEMALISARSVSVEQTKRYAAGISDPARTVTAYAGVMNNGDVEENAVIIRGNSPRGVLWRLEGMEIPNPNHFASEGSSNGAVGILSTNVIGQSDFYTGAFPAEFGNALSGVFDLHLRKGNNEQHEYTLQVGMLGLEAAAEGPLGQKGGASFLVNYRYSTLAMLNNLGVQIAGDGDRTGYQDLAFKLHFPTNKGGFSLYGIGGTHRHWQRYNRRFEDTEKGAMGLVGISNLHIINDKTYLKSSLSYSGTNLSDVEDDLGENPLYDYDERFRKGFMRANMVLNSKINAQHILETGVTYTHWKYDFYVQIQNAQGIPPFNNFSAFDSKGNTNMLQGFGSWKYRLADNWTFVGGVHALYFGLNDKVSVEPRAALQWQLSEQSSLSFGYGLHSRIESLEYYLANRVLEDGTVFQYNKDLDLAKSHHFVWGYDYYFNPKLHLKIEAYYQRLFNIPVAVEEDNLFSSILVEAGYTARELTNEGKGNNAGFELTLERFFANNYYFLFSGALFQANYKILDNVRRNTPFDSGFNFSLLGGKEFPLGANKQNIIGVNLRGSWSGGQRYSPIDLEYSRFRANEIIDPAHAFERFLPDYKRLDVQLNYRRNKKHTTTEWRLDLLNATGHHNTLGYYYDEPSQQIKPSKGNGILPVLSWRYEF